MKPILIKFMETYKRKGMTCAETVLTSNKTLGPFFKIVMNKRLNTRLLMYVRTIFHELFHVGFWIIKMTKHIEYTPYSEELFIQEIEDQILIAFHLLKKVD